nr:GLUG motif-containing protein [Anaerohalosphaeraceae bacterium]
SSNGDFLGGIIGCMKSGSVDNCYSTGSVKGRCRVGGLVGVMSNSTMTNCYSASNVSGLSDVGGLMGLCSDSYSLILNCYSLGDVTGTSTSVGGLMGNNCASIANCCSMSNVTGSYDSRVLGGLVGYNSGSICNSSCTGNVVGDDYVGGLIGYQYTGSVINCYSHGNVTGDSYIGGLVGYQRDCSDTAIEKCYSTGKVTGNNKKGGLLGYQSGSSSRVAACFWDIETSGMTDGVGNMNPAPGDVEGKTTAEMQMLSTFMDAGWDFTDTDADAAEWWMPSNHYPLLSWDRYGGGFGTIFMPYQIWTAEQMNAIGAAPDDWDKHFKLMADMDMSAYTGTQYHVVGNSTTKFTGSFDGNGHKISNLTYSTSKAVECLGLFGRIKNAVIKNLVLDDVSLVSGSGNVGGLVGWNDSGTLSVCSATGSIRGTGHLGGLVGRNDAGTLTACYANCSINGTSIIGGLVGGNYAGSIKDCYATGSVAGTGSFIGGLTGYNNKGKLATCYAADSVGEAGTRVGGLVGWNSTDSEVIACFWDTQVSGKSAGVGGGSSSGIIGKTTAEMKMFMTFIDAEWKFTNTGIGWLMLRPNEDYPRLSWQEIYAGDIVGMYGVDLADYEVLARYWMHTDCPATARCENADLDGNGAVDLIDYSILVENWMRQ